LGTRSNLDFYTGDLGLRFVKKVVNLHDPSTYHFYNGDETGSPGTILTFFPWTTARQAGAVSAKPTRPLPRPAAHNRLLDPALH
jgi:catechol 2,3-dioxygenase-like lactoylglutathione lyase family enzyme